LAWLLNFARSYLLGMVTIFIEKINFVKKQNSNIIVNCLGFQMS